VLRRLRIENLVLIREAELAFASGLNAITGETGAGKTILAQAIGLLLGAKGEAGYVGPGAPEAYVEAELDLPEGLLDEEGFEAIAELRPEDEDGLVLARRVTAEGRTRAYAWGRSVPREELAGLAERLIAMSGQFEQRRLARAAYQLEVLDAFIGAEQLRRRGEARDAWRALQAARRYSTAEMSAKLRRAGFSVQRMSYANFLIFPAAAAWRLLRRGVHGDEGSDVASMPAWLNALMGVVYRAEAGLFRRTDLPIGTSIIALATKNL